LTQALQQDKTRDRHVPSRTAKMFRQVEFYSTDNAYIAQ